MTIKFTMLFELRTNLQGRSIGSRIAGWSESVYSAASVGVVQNDLQLKRAALLPAGGRIVGQRIQQVFPAGGANTTGFTFPSPSVLESDVPSMSLLCTAAASNANNKRTWAIRGIPDIQVFEGEYRPRDGFDGLVAAYFRSLRDGFWQFPGRDLTIRPSPMVSISAGGIVVMPAAYEVEAGDTVAIRDAEVGQGLVISGRYKVKSVESAVSFTLVNWNLPATSGGVITNTTAKVLFPFGACQVQRVVQRKVGRPSGQYRGRATKRR